jgi:hypothetical protein
MDNSTLTDLGLSVNFSLDVHHYKSDFVFYRANYKLKSLN